MRARHDFLTRASHDISPRARRDLPAVLFCVWLLALAQMSLASTLHSPRLATPDLACVTCLWSGPVGHEPALHIAMLSPHGWTALLAERRAGGADAIAAPLVRRLASTRRRMRARQHAIDSRHAARRPMRLPPGPPRASAQSGILAIAMIAVLGWMGGLAGTLNMALRCLPRRDPARRPLGPMGFGRVTLPRRWAPARPALLLLHGTCPCRTRPVAVAHVPTLPCRSRWGLPSL